MYGTIVSREVRCTWPLPFCQFSARNSSFPYFVTLILYRKERVSENGTRASN
jgi:hypothetical protein